jgi:hypothetical protein
LLQRDAASFNLDHLVVADLVIFTHGDKGFRLVLGLLQEAGVDSKNSFPNIIVDEDTVQLNGPLGKLGGFGSRLGRFGIHWFALRRKKVLFHHQWLACGGGLRGNTAGETHQQGHQDRPQMLALKPEEQTHRSHESSKSSPSIHMLPSESV